MTTERDRFLHYQGEKWHEGILKVGLMCVRTNDLLSRARSRATRVMWISQVKIKRPDRGKPDSLAKFSDISLVWNHEEGLNRQALFAVKILECLGLPRLYHL